MALTWPRPAAQSAQGDKLAALQTGVSMIQAQFKSLLSEAGVEEVDATGKPFDPAVHEAISQQESVGVPEGGVIQQSAKATNCGTVCCVPPRSLSPKKPSQTEPPNPDSQFSLSHGQARLL